MLPKVPLMLKDAHPEDLVNMVYYNFDSLVVQAVVIAVVVAVIFVAVVAAHVELQLPAVGCW